LKKRRPLPSDFFGASLLKGNVESNPIFQEGGVGFTASDVYEMPDAPE
jgi:hypothetical protein